MSWVSAARRAAIYSARNIPMSRNVPPPQVKEGSQFFDLQVGDEPSMPPVVIGKGMDGDEAVMHDRCLRLSSKLDDFVYVRRHL